MTYKEKIIECTNRFNTDPKARFIGYNTAKGSRMYGTLAEVETSKCLEMPVCENLMVGMACGMALEGYRPVVCFERHDFLLLALDALINHMDKMPYLSSYQFRWRIIVRAIVGAKKPLNAGPQHTQNYTRALRAMLQYTEVVEPMSEYMFESAWFEKVKWSRSGAVVIIEHKDRYDWEIGKSSRMFEESSSDLKSFP